MTDITKLKPGDILSEMSHYKVTGIHGSSVELNHYGSGETVTISDGYIEKISLIQEMNLMRKSK